MTIVRMAKRFYGIKLKFVACHRMFLLVLVAIFIFVVALVLLEIFCTNNKNFKRGWKYNLNGLRLELK